MHGAGLAAAFGLMCAAVPKVEASLEEAFTTEDVTQEACGALPGGVSVVGTGCTLGVAGSEWLTQWEKELAARGLRPIKKPSAEIFGGLGDTRKESCCEWTFPVGIRGGTPRCSFRRFRERCRASPRRRTWRGGEL